MANITGATNHFSTAKENGAAMTLTSSITAPVGTVAISNLTANYNDGDTVTLVIDPSNATLKQTFTGVVNAGTNSVTGVTWTEGTNQPHASGAAIVDYVTATDWVLLQSGILKQHKQDGTHTGITTDTLTVTTGVTVPDNSIPRKALNTATFAFGRLTYSAIGGGSGGQVVGAAADAVVAFNSLDSHSVSMTSTTPGYLTVNDSGVYTITFAIAFADVPNTISVMKIRAVVSGTTIDLTPWSHVGEFATGGINRGSVASVTYYLRAGDQVFGVFSNQASNATRINWWNNQDECFLSAVRVA
jgi:hypothetical protein